MVYKTPTPVRAFRSPAPVVLEAITAYARLVAEWKRRAAVLPAELGQPGREVVIRQFGASRHVAGLSHDPKTLPPLGWSMRRNSATGLCWVVPKRSDKKGRDLFTRMRDDDPPLDPRGLLPGMPAEVKDGADLVMATDLRVAENTAWILWSCPVPGVDPDLWEPVPLSRYWLMRENDPDEQARQRAEHPQAATLA